MTRPTPVLALCALTLASTAVAQEVNVYSYREPALIQPLMDAFTAETGVWRSTSHSYQQGVDRTPACGRSAALLQI